ncbi:glycosyltransferase 29 protein [Cymbomonas tetramitiformis]|uniref:Glycosyltransferase 29 protein n=1 Tax=Cymbomonas tetramitiformis TaxID=36881 RepID=A0AAE0BIH5_9CHLO|nr:glycosyltransferase 29 protein [Cymbomonas tetramitiformis]
MGPKVKRAPKKGVGTDASGSSETKFSEENNDGCNATEAHPNMQAVFDQVRQCEGAPRPWAPIKRSPEDQPSRSLLSDFGDVSQDGATPRRHLQGIDNKSTPLREAYCKQGALAAGAKLPPPELKSSAIACCIAQGGNGCNAPKSLLHTLAGQLPSIAQIKTAPPCYRVIKNGTCSTVDGNPETEIRGSYQYDFRPKSDWRLRAWGTCAIVGRSPIIKLEYNGRYIDKHDAVWRFNLASLEGVAQYTGSRTTLRIINNEDAKNMLNDVKGRSEAADVTLTEEEEILFWQYASVRYINRISLKNQVPVRLVPVRLVAPAFITWQMNLYFAMKRDLEYLGFGPFPCPTSLSSGMHAVLMALKLCGRVNLFGFSYYDDMLAQKGGHTNGLQQLPGLLTAGGQEVLFEPLEPPPFPFMGSLGTSPAANAGALSPAKEPQTAHPLRCSQAPAV